MIRVGRCTYSRSQRYDPEYSGFTPILVMMRSHSQWYPLSPYELKDDNGKIMENIWQFSKVYREVPYSRQHYSRYDKTIIWEYPPEVHIKNDGNLTPEYFNWRSLGMNNKYPVRYPVGFYHRHECICSITNEGIICNYIEARKRIYMPVYRELVRKEKKFIELKNRLFSGENLLIIEVDGPHQESLEYYQEKYSVGNDFIENGTILANEENLNIMLNDDKYAFGHGYCLAAELLDLNLS